MKAHTIIDLGTGIGIVEDDRGGIEVSGLLMSAQAAEALRTVLGLWKYNMVAMEEEEAEETVEEAVSQQLI